MTCATIFALSTPPGRSAIAVVRLSGPMAGTVLDAMCPPRPEARRAVLRKLEDAVSGDAGGGAVAAKTILDEALVIYFAAPRTETGEDMAELHLHGGRAIVRAVLEALAQMPGLRPAEPGEFARRAFENGKLDLAEIEGLADLIDAETEAQRRQGMAQASGVQSKRFEGFRADVLGAMGLVEAAIDFSDEGDVSERAVAQAQEAVRSLQGKLTSQLADGHRGEILREGFRVVLAGPPNAGKSSLLNALARREAAIVSAEAGTTRDVIDVRLDLEGFAVIVSDTAGIRETSSHVEQEGIRRTLQATREADLVVWLQDPNDPHPGPPHVMGEALLCREGEGAVRLHLLTKSDLVAGAGGGAVAVESKAIHVKQPSHLPSPGTGEGGGTPDEGLETPRETDITSSPSPVAARHPLPLREREEKFDLAVSAKTGAGLDELTAEIARRARAAVGNASDPALTRVRHRREIETAVGHLAAFMDEPSRGLELRAEDLRRAGVALGRLTGRIDAEEVLGEIFSRFCIGK